MVNVNQKELFILQQDLSLWAPSLIRTIPIPSLTRNMDWRIYFVTKPQGKISKFLTTQTRNRSKQTAAQCYISNSPSQLHQGKYRLHLDSREIEDLTMTPVALSWPLVSVQLTQLRSVSSRGECWNVLTELQLCTQNLCVLQGKQRQNLGAEKKWFGFT